jgi:hypothetical protein
MRKFFAAIFGGQDRRTIRPAPKARLGVEELTPRVLPSAGCSLAAAGASAARTAFANGSADSESFSGDHGDHGGHSCGAEHATLAASLTDASGATGTASFNSNSGALFVSVTGATASTTLAVTVDGTSVGSVTTDASGNGHAKLTGVTAAAGSTVMVGDLTGTFAQTKFTALLTGATGVNGSATYKSVKNQLHVSVTGATAGTTYNVTVNGTVVGQITTNSRGRGRLNVTPTGVTFAAGSTISIADTAGDAAILTGTFA